MIAFENKPEIGTGIFTPREVAKILQLPYKKVARWIDEYWDKKLGGEFGGRYSWKTEGSKAVSFHTLVELYIMLQFSEAGVKPKAVVQAHKELSGVFNTTFPFALKEVLDGIKTDGKHIYFTFQDHTVLTLDGTGQINMEFIRLFFQKLEFDSQNLASRLWPMGKENSILIDPSRKFGHPVIEGRNIYPETIFNHYKAGDSIADISFYYELTEKQVRDAIEYVEAA